MWNICVNRKVENKKKSIDVFSFDPVSWKKITQLFGSVYVKATFLWYGWNFLPPPPFLSRYFWHVRLMAPQKEEEERTSNKNRLESNNSGELEKKGIYTWVVVLVVQLSGGKGKLSF